MVHKPSKINLKQFPGLNWDRVTTTYLDVQVFIFPSSPDHHYQEHTDKYHAYGKHQGIVTDIGKTLQSIPDVNFVHLREGSATSKYGQMIAIAHCLPLVGFRARLCEH